MLLFWLDAGYLVGMAAWLVILWGILVWMLRRRRMARLNSVATKRSLHSRILTVCFGLWFLCASLTAAELVFALFVDHSEAFNASMIAKRWFQVHFDSQRNEDGFRERRLLATRLPEGVSRILFLGDSFTAGHGVNRIDDRFTEQLEVLLNSKGSPKYQVYNMGEPGFEISMIRAMESAVLEKEYPVKTLIYCYMMNDIEGYDPKTGAAIEEISKRRQSSSWLVSHSFFINWMYHRWVQYSAGSSVDYFPHLVESYDGPPWQAVEHELDNMAAMCEAKGVGFRLVIFPFLHNLGPDYPFLRAHEKLVAWAHSKSVPVLDMMPIFTSHLNEKLTVNSFDNHPNERAHQIIAEELFKWLHEESGRL
ncbi:MAG: hypothetical protein U0936_23810 [Planctomycetaceae bacterium]